MFATVAGNEPPDLAVARTVPLSVNVCGDADKATPLQIARTYAAPNLAFDPLGLKVPTELGWGVVAATISSYWPNRSTSR